MNELDNKITTLSNKNDGISKYLISNQNQNKILTELDKDKQVLKMELGKLSNTIKEFNIKFEQKFNELNEKIDELNNDLYRQQRNNESLRIRYENLEQLNENDPKSPWFGVLDRQQYRGSVVDIVETIDELCNNLEKYMSLQNKAVGYRRVLREYVVYGSDGITPLKIDGKIIKKRELSDYNWLSYEQLFERKNHIAKGLLSAGIKRNEPIAILCETCAEYLMMEFAIARAGFVQVNVFPTLGESGIAHAIKETNSKFIFTSWDLLPKIRSVIQKYKLDVSKIIYIERRAETVSDEIIAKEKDFIEPINQSIFVPLTKIEQDGQSCNDDDVAICKPLDKDQVAFIGKY